MLTKFEEKFAIKTETNKGAKKCGWEGETVEALWD